MQGKNSTKSPKLVPRDGTQEVPRKEGSDANWFGTSQEPQEEYIENDPAPADPHDARGAHSEGEPTIKSNR